MKLIAMLVGGIVAVSAPGVANAALTAVLSGENIRIEIDYGGSFWTYSERCNTDGTCYMPGGHLWDHQGQTRFFLNNIFLPSYSAAPGWYFGTDGVQSRMNMFIPSGYYSNGLLDFQAETNFNVYLGAYVPGTYDLSGPMDLPVTGSFQFIFNSCYIEDDDLFDQCREEYGDGYAASGTIDRFRIFRQGDVIVDPSPVPLPLPALFVLSGFLGLFAVSRSRRVRPV